MNKSGPGMDKRTVGSLLHLSEPMAALSIAHLSLSTRRKLAANDLSVVAYPP
jgi:ABC-type hemin transport system ATPase subunit